MDLKTKYAKAFRTINMEPRAYVMKRGIPIAAAAVLVAVGLAVTGSLYLPTLMHLLLPPIIGAAGLAGAAIAPIAMADRRRLQIDEAMPFFMTHFGVLSTSNIPRTEMIRLLAKKKEYGALSTELARIYNLVTDWNMALPEACRFLSESTPSEIFGDFLERLAHAMETGQDIESFLQSEQSIVMKEYATVYESSIYQIEQWKDIYISSVMSGAFFVLFSIITPILTGQNPESLLIGVLGFMMFMEVLLLMVLRLRLPSDKLLHALDIPVEEIEKTKKYTYIGAAVGVVVTTVLWLVTPLTLGFATMIGVAPAAITGFLADRAETRIKRREDNYGAFVRSLGASLAARGGSPREVMKQVRTHNFGPLTQIVHSLYARLSWRIDDASAWKHFSAESGSHIVDAYTDMFVEGLRTGGDPDKIGSIISENVVRVLNLRKARYGTAGTFRGLLYGLTASIAFVMAAGVGIMGVLGGLFSDAAAASTSSELNPIDLDFDVNLTLIGNLILVLLLLHSLLGALMLKMIDGGGSAAGLGTFAILVWLSVALLQVSGWLLPTVFDVGGTG